MRDLFRIYGLGNLQIDEIITVLRTNRLFISQVIDLLRIWQGELTAMVTSLTNALYKAFSDLLTVFPIKGPTEIDGRPAGNDKMPKTTDVYIRDILSSAAGFIELDRLLEKLLSFLSGRVVSGHDDMITPVDTLKQEKDFFVLDDLSEEDAMSLSPLLGGKAKNLAYLKQQGLEVPSGVVFSARKTEYFQQYTGRRRLYISFEKSGKTY